MRLVFVSERRGVAGAGEKWGTIPPPCVCRQEGGPMHLLREQKGQQEQEKKRREKKERYYKKKRWHIPTTLAGRGVHPRER